MHDKKSVAEKPAGGQHFRPKSFSFNDADHTATCPAGQVLTRSGRIHITASGQPYQTYIAKTTDCGSCALRRQCIKTRETDEKKIPPAGGRQVSRFLPKVPDPSRASERMRQAIDSPRGRQFYSQRIGAVEPVFANLRHNKRLARVNHRGQGKVRKQWSLYCMVHNNEKLSKAGLGQTGVQ